MSSSYALLAFHQMTRPRVGYCEACGEPCRPHVVDFGHGEPRYAGAVNKRVVSQCCDADILDEPVAPDDDEDMEYP